MPHREVHVPIRKPDDSRVAKLPPDYTVGVQCTTFEGMLMYQGKPFILWGCFMRWSEVETYSLRQLIPAIKHGNVFYARKKARPMPAKKRKAQHGA